MWNKQLFIFLAKNSEKNYISDMTNISIVILLEVIVFVSKMDKGNVNRTMMSV